MRCKFAVTQNVLQNVGTVLWHTPTFSANSCAVHRRLASNRETRTWTALFSTLGHPLWSLSWTASLTSWNALTHHATVRYDNAALPHASRSLWKHSCVLRPRATSILIQEHCSSFVNMVLGSSHYPYESQHSSQCSRLTEYCHRWLH